MDASQRVSIAKRVAQDIPEGSYVNLGIGLPTLVADFFTDKEVILHSENGVLGQWSQAEEGAEDWDLINAGKEPIELKAGGAFFHHADSFGMMRGGHLDYCILGAFQVSANGDLANWHTGKPDDIPSVGGAMDLASGAKNVFVMMQYLTREGDCKILENCSYPLTGLGCVNRVYTDVGIFEFDHGKVYLLDVFEPYDVDYIKSTCEIKIDYTKLNSK